MKDKFVFTPDNLIDNYDKVGPWSNCYLAEIAIRYYEPRFNKLQRELRMGDVQLMAHLCDEWQTIVWLYHLDVGYKSFPDGYVNEY
jgi:hypothetical protein